MKIICEDNYGRETRDDIVVAEKVNIDFGKVIVDLLNNDPSWHNEYHFKLVEDDYKPYIFQP